MKRINFLLASLMILLMSISITSCLKGSDNKIQSGTIFAKCVNSYPPTFQLANNQKFVVTNLPLTATLHVKEMYFFYYQFDTTSQSADAPSLNVTLMSGSTIVPINAKPSEGPENKSGINQANAPIYLLNGHFQNSLIQPNVLYDNEYLLVPIVYWVKAESTEEGKKIELAKHSFVLTYDAESIQSGTTEFVLTLNHIINDGDAGVERGNYTSSVKAYSIQSAMSFFKNKAGHKPTKIVVKAKTNPMANTLKGAIEEVWEYNVK